MKTIVILFGCLLALSSGVSIQSRIRGGQSAFRGQFPHHAAIKFGSTYKCGGAIASEKYIITAAHCFDENDAEVQVMVGTNDLHNNEENHLVEKVIIHPSYNPSTHTADIALVKLATPLSYGPYVRPVNLPHSEIETGTKLLLTGWGSTAPGNFPDILQYIEVPILDSQRCSTMLNDVVSATQVCTYGGSSQGTCVGDGGSPLITDHFYLTGIVSNYKECPSAGQPDVHTKVSMYVDWIEQNLANK